MFYNTSKKMNKNYVHLLKGNKTTSFGYNLNAGPHHTKSHQNVMNPSSPTYQKHIPLSSKYNQANLIRSSGGLMASTMMGMNTNSTVVTTHVNTSGHIIQTSTSAPKTADMDPAMIPPTNLYYSRRYSLPVGHCHTDHDVNNNILINVTVPDEDRETEHDVAIEEALTPPPPYGDVHTIKTSSTHLIHGLCRHPRQESTTSSSGSSEDDDHTLHSTQSMSHNGSLDRLGEPSSLRVMPSSSFTKTLKPISEGMVSQSDTTNTTLQNSDASTNSTTTTTTTSTTSPNHENNYTLYKTSASTNLCALNQASSNIQRKQRPNYNVKMMSGGVKQGLNHHPSLKSSSVESAASNTAITPIYF